MTLELVATAAGVTTAALVVYVAYLSYNGYRRNNSQTMLLLAVGVICIAVVPYLITYAVSPALALTDAETVFAVTIAHLVGLSALARSFSG